MARQVEVLTLMAVMTCLALSAFSMTTEKYLPLIWDLGIDFRPVSFSAPRGGRAELAGLYGPGGTDVSELGTNGEGKRKWRGMLVWRVADADASAERSGLQWSKQTGFRICSTARARTYTGTLA